MRRLPASPAGRRDNASRATRRSAVALPQRATSRMLWGAFTPVGSRGLVFKDQRRRNPFPDMTEDAFPAVAVDAGVVELALRRPSLRQMAAPAGSQIFAFLTDLAWTQ